MNSTHDLVIAANKITETSALKDGTLDITFNASNMFSVPAAIALVVGHNGDRPLSVDAVNVNLSTDVPMCAVENLLNVVKSMIRANKYSLFTHDLDIDATPTTGFDVHRYPPCDFNVISDAAKIKGCLGIAIVEKCEDNSHFVHAFVNFAAIPKELIDKLPCKWRHTIDDNDLDELEDEDDDEYEDEDEDEEMDKEKDEKEEQYIVQSYKYMCSDEDPDDDGGVPGSVDFWISSELECHDNHQGSTLSEVLDDAFNKWAILDRIDTHKVIMACSLTLVNTQGVNMAEAALTGKPLKMCKIDRTGVEPAADKLLYMRPGHEAAWGRV